LEKKPYQKREAFFLGRRQLAQDAGCQSPLEKRRLLGGGSPRKVRNLFVLTIESGAEGKKQWGEGEYTKTIFEGSF